MHKELSNCRYIFLRYDAVRSTSLQALYGGPYDVMERREKTFTINGNGSHVRVNIDRVKSAFVVTDNDNCDEQPLRKENLPLIYGKRRQSCRPYPRDHKHRENNYQERPTTRIGRIVCFWQAFLIPVSGRLSMRIV